jgi:DNA-binding IclR family transcriptional regulator
MKQNNDNRDQTNYKSISRVAKILACLRDGNTTVTEIAKQCNLSKPTISRLLKAMESSDLVIRDINHRRCFIGPLLSSLMANPQTAHLNLITLSTEEMNRLSELCSETVVLGTLIGIQNIRLHTIASKHNLRVHDIEDAKSAVPRLLGSATRMQMSQLNPKELESVINIVKIAYKNKNLVFNDKEFVMKVNRAKDQGYEISRGERAAGGMSISAPIKGYAFPATLTILGIESRIDHQVEKLVDEIVASTKRISNNIHALR